MLSSLAAEQLGALAQSPNWEDLDVYQRCWTRDSFERELRQVYLPYIDGEPWIRIEEDRALIRMDADDSEQWYTLWFANSKASEPGMEGRFLFWDPKRDLPLKGLRIALDAGHIGGRFAQMEGRYFHMGDDPPVCEGDLTLKVVDILASRLEALGATVFKLRQDGLPLTWSQPRDFLELAESIEREKPEVNQETANELKERVRRRSELLFYRVSEIQARADWINHVIRPDFTIAVHFNVSPWEKGPNGEKALSDSNHMHLLVNGTYMPEELSLDNVRFEMMHKLLDGNHRLEIPMSDAVAEALKLETGLPPFIYHGKNASAQGSSEYVWGRNLLANRIYEGPVLFMEAYSVNSKEGYARVQAGDYEGTRMWDGVPRKNIFEEYADGIVRGVVNYFEGLRSGD